MSPTFGFREISEGPTVGYHGSDAPPPPPPAYVGKVQEERGGDGVVAVESKISGISCISMGLESGEEGQEGKSMERNGFCLDLNGPISTGSSSSSSIGAGVDSSSITDGGDEGGGVEDEVQSKFKGGLGSMASLESSLPIKRGLSNYFTGKSKSFTSLSEVTTIKDLAKPENSYNKRRKTLVTYKAAWIQSKSAFKRPLTNSTSMSLLSPDFVLEEEDEEEEREEEEAGEEEEKKVMAPLPLHKRKLKSYKKTPRSFSLTDLGDA
ncbi:MTD1 family protein [Cinnamomum micranthum f. kanehirae]|uniref:MTD1 family protein n=1 Tax=Cinnamomum micranthum f. kanehirae TaxID=337451 RepID=A0A443PL21_9MAGN|nr:MTD1 family protein [Cinnamomum micranthum f. kanehirae]